MPYEKSELTKQQIKDAARNLFYENGFKKTTVRAIAEKANLMNSGAIFYHYASKDEIIADIFIEEFKRMMDKADSLISIKDKPLANTAFCMKFSFKVMFYDDKNKELFLEIVNSEWLDRIIINRNIKLYEYFALKYDLNIDSEQLKIFVLSTRGTETKLIQAKIKNEISTDDDDIYNYIIKTYPLLLGIDVQKIENSIKEADSILSTIDIKDFLIFY